MMVLYISKAFDDNIGATMHYRAIKEIFGEKNVYAIDLRPFEAFEREQYKAYGKYKHPYERIIRWAQGNMMFISNNIIADIIKFIKCNNINIVFIEDSVFGNLVRAIKIKCLGVKVISFYHDVKAILYSQWIKTAKIQGKIECMIGIRQEKINQKFSDINLVFNKRDRELFKKTYDKYPEGCIALPAPIPNISEEQQNRITSEEAQKKLLFVGKKYRPNIAGIKWFYKNVLPRLNSNIAIDIIGRELEYLKEELNDTRINVIGGVDSLDSYYKNADIVIAPLFEGGGMKSKTVEAVSYGKVFVGTEESLFGFWEEMNDSIRNRTVFQCNTADKWIYTINELSNRSIPKFNESVYKLFLEKFSYNSAREQLRKIMM